MKKTNFLSSTYAIYSVYVTTAFIAVFKVFFELLRIEGWKTQTSWSITRTVFLGVYPYYATCILILIYSYYYDVEIMHLIAETEFIAPSEVDEPTIKQALPDGHFFDAHKFKSCVNDTITDNLSDADVKAALHNCIERSGL
nr:hypothetical protein [Nitzschia ovalis]